MSIDTTMDGVAADTSRPRDLLRIVCKVASTVVTAALIAVAGLTVVLAVFSRLSPDGQFNVFGHPAMVVVSGSMSPVIDTGDLIVVDPVSLDEASRLHVGQIISFRGGAGSATVITHRIVGVTSQDGAVAYFTKGDANQAQDLVARPAADVVGVFNRRIPRGGYLLMNLQRPLVLGLLLASPVLWFLAGSLFQFARELDEGLIPEVAVTGR